MPLTLLGGTAVEPRHAVRASHDQRELGQRHMGILRERLSSSVRQPRQRHADHLSHDAPIAALVELLAQPARLADVLDQCHADH